MKFKFNKKEDEKEPSHFTPKKTEAVKVSTKEASEVKFQPAVKKEEKKVEKTAKEMAQTPFTELDPSNAKDAKEIIRRRNMGFN